MKEIIKNDWPYLILTSVLTILSILSIDSFKYGFNTAYDQAYMLLKLQEAYDGTFITGKSQWNLIAVHLFPYLDLTNKAASFLAANILNWITIIICTITASKLYDTKRFIMYFALIFLVYFQNANHGQGLSYVTMQGAFLCWALCFFMLFYNSKEIISKCIFAFLTGLIMACCCFIILPSALVISIYIFGLVLYTYHEDIYLMRKCIIAGIAGAFVTLIYIHLAVCPLNEIVEAMIETSKYFTKGCSYDSGSMILMYAFFFRDFMFMIVSFLGIYWLSQRIPNVYIGKTFYAIFCIIFVYYCNKLHSRIHIEAFMSIASICIIPYLFNDNRRNKDLKNPICFYHAFIFLFPIIAILGTNTGVIGRLYLFVVAWIFLFFEQTYALPKSKYCELLITVVLFFFVPSAASMNSSLPMVIRNNMASKKINTCHYNERNKNFAKIAITPIQEKYYHNIDSILCVYNYIPHKSSIFAMVYDYSNIYVFDAVNAAHFHAAEYFPYMDVSKQEAPDFIFICRMDSMAIDNSLRMTHWKWPEAYDEYVVGNPEDPSIPAWYNIPDINRRYLYCRKSLKKAQ